ncbi:50S ribosomal protein L22 [Candidatus Peregrinibacteria bacterium]|nr:50S ribosomal protein L22 [Candidatus Peregrinibacteria bacterium]MBI3815928.1 50S ribosomal protein L22 [Candidatus Peregrinibacteria bacterium]
MHASARSARIAPKKANLVARMVRGMAVPDAMEALRRTDKKAARIIELVLRSAVANASHNDRQDPQMMVIKTIVVNQGRAYRRGMPKARGQMRPYRKFLSHIDLVLGFPADNEEGRMKNEKLSTQNRQPSQRNENTVKTSQASPENTTNVTSASGTHS